MLGDTQSWGSNSRLFLCQPSNISSITWPTILSPFLFLKWFPRITNDGFCRLFPIFGYHIMPIMKSVCTRVLVDTCDCLYHLILQSGIAGFKHNVILNFNRILSKRPPRRSNQPSLLSVCLSMPPFPPCSARWSGLSRSTKLLERED